MAWSVRSFIEAREATERLLTDLGLENYLFDVEPSGDGWDIHLECEARQGWKVMRLKLAEQQLENALHDEARRSQLIATLRERFSDCCIVPGRLR